MRMRWREQCDSMFSILNLNAGAGDFVLCFLFLFSVAADDGGQSLRNGNFGRDFGSHSAACAWLEHCTCDVLRRQRRRRHSRSDTILLLLLLPHSLQVTSSSEVSAVQEIISDVLSSVMLS